MKHRSPDCGADFLPPTDVLPALPNSESDFNRSSFIHDARVGLYDWSHNMNRYQAAALVGAVGVVAIVGFTTKVLWEAWRKPSL